MPKLISLEEMIDYLDVSADQEINVGPILAAVEEMLEKETGARFGPAAIITQERQNGTGLRTLYVDYPIALVTGVWFGHDTDYSVEYEVDIVNDLMYRAGERKLTTRLACFPRGLGNVRVSYESQEYTPEIAKQAVREATSMLYRTRGSEDARSEHAGSFEHVLKRSMAESHAWSTAVRLLHRPVLPT